MTIPGGYIAGDVLTAANLNLAPAGTQGGGYAQRTTSQASITSMVDIASLTVTFTAVAGRRYKATVMFHWEQTVADGAFFVYINDTVSNLMRFTVDEAANRPQGKMFAYANLTSITGVKTWKVRCERDSGTASGTFFGAATYPAFISIEDIGQI